VIEFVRAQETLPELKELIGALGTSQIMRGRGAWSLSDAELWRHALDRVVKPARLQSAFEDLPRWHEQQASLCESKTNWFAARFHYLQLQQLAPTNAAYSSRLAAVENHLRPASTSP
jgi:hypothetical protein